MLSAHGSLLILHYDKLNLFSSRVINAAAAANSLLLLPPFSQLIELKVLTIQILVG
jgi:hypothetical protein